MHTLKSRLREPVLAILYVAGDKSALRPSGLRLGSPALTSRGLMEEDFQVVAEYIHRCELLAFYSLILLRRVSIDVLNYIVIVSFLVLGIQLTVEIQTNMNPKATLKEFKVTVAQDEKYQNRIREIRDEVQAFAGKFPMPGLPEL